MALWESIHAGGSRGVLAYQHLHQALDEGLITAETPVPAESVQPASLDLRLGRIAHRMRCSFLSEHSPVEEKIAQYSMGSLDLRGGAILERNRPYLVRLEEQLALPREIRGKANPKSSTGRLDVFTRLVTDRAHVFDEVAPGYRGALYLEIVPRTFTIEVHEGQSLNQLRLIVGDATLDPNELSELYERSPLLYRDGEPTKLQSRSVSGGVFVGVDVGHGHDAVVGYRARENSSLIDLSRRNHYDVTSHWEVVHPDGAGFIVLNPETFYLLMSQDEIRVPPGCAAEMTAYDPTSGELRAHYAGFFDPGFGWHGDGTLPMGTKAALEVRAHDVAFAVEQGQRMCRLTYERMLDEPERIYSERTGSSYALQSQAVGKQFRTG